MEIVADLLPIIEEKILYLFSYDGLIINDYEHYGFYDNEFAKNHIDSIESFWFSAKKYLARSIKSVVSWVMKKFIFIRVNFDGITKIPICMSPRL